MQEFITVCQALTRIGTALAGLSACRAYRCMHLGAPKHEVGARRTDLGAILQGAHMGDLGIFAAYLNVLVGRLDTDVVALGALLDAVLHVPGMLMVHGWFSPGRVRTPTLSATNDRAIHVPICRGGDDTP
jgi:hypothetical protein